MNPLGNRTYPATKCPFCTQLRPPPLCPYLHRLYLILLLFVIFWHPLEITAAIMGVLVVAEVVVSPQLLVLVLVLVLVLTRHLRPLRLY
jgi:hypothetical protein